MRIIKLTRAAEKSLLKRHEIEDHDALRIAGRIVDDVKRRGDLAVNAWTRKLDGTDLDESGLWLSGGEFAAARKLARPEFLSSVKHAIANIRRVAEKQKPVDWTLQVENGVRVGQRVKPIESIGCYIPGGRFALVSTLLMTVVPAQVAGVRQIVAVCPHPNDELLAAAELLGLTRLARIGGAQ